MDNILKRVCRGCMNPGHITKEEAKSVFDNILKGKGDPVQISAFLTGMRMKGETQEELEGFYEATVSLQRDIGSRVENELDLGVNYDGKIKTPHILPSAIFIAMGCGVNMSSHGTEGVPAKFGPSFIKVLGKMINTEGSLFVKEGFRYADQKEFVPELYKLKEIRKRLGFRTFINVIEKLLNPFNAENIITSVAHNPYFEKVYNLLLKAGFKRITVVKGVEGGIEPYPDRKTTLMLNGEFMEIDPSLYGLTSDLPKGNLNIEEQAKLNISIIKNENNIYKNWALLTSALLLLASGKVSSIKEGVELSKDCLESGKAKECFEQFGSG